MWASGSARGAARLREALPHDGGIVQRGDEPLSLEPDSNGGRPGLGAARGLRAPRVGLPSMARYAGGGPYDQCPSCLREVLAWLAPGLRRRRSAAEDPLNRGFPGKATAETATTRLAALPRRCACGSNGGCSAAVGERGGRAFMLLVLSLIRFFAVSSSRAPTISSTGYRHSILSRGGGGENEPQ
jgi:hypothetical protein